MMLRSAMSFTSLSTHVKHINLVQCCPCTLLFSTSLIIKVRGSSIPNSKRLNMSPSIVNGMIGLLFSFLKLTPNNLIYHNYPHRMP